jgi:hypothetical protein
MPLEDNSYLFFKEYQRAGQKKRKNNTRISILA